METNFALGFSIRQDWLDAIGREIPKTTEELYEDLVELSLIHILMECLGEKDYDYWFFAGITGDLFTQHFARNISKYDAVSTYRRKENSAEFIEELFKKCGYDATYVSNQELRNNRE